MHKIASFFDRRRGWFGLVGIPYASKSFGKMTLVGGGGILARFLGMNRHFGDSLGCHPGCAAALMKRYPRAVFLMQAESPGGLRD